MFTNIHPCRRCGVLLSWDPESKTHPPTPVGYWDTENDEPAQYQPGNRCPGTFMHHGIHEPSPINP